MTPAAGLVAALPHFPGLNQHASKKRLDFRLTTHHIGHTNSSGRWAPVMTLAGRRKS